MLLLRSPLSRMKPLSKSILRHTSQRSLFACRVHCSRMVSPKHTGMYHHLKLIRPFSSNIPEDKENTPPSPPPPPLPQKRGLIGGTIFAGSMLFGKTKYVLAALKVTKMAPLASMVITSATYSLFFGWPYAIGG